MLMNMTINNETFAQALGKGVLSQPPNNHKKAIASNPFVNRVSA